MKKLNPFKFGSVVDEPYFTNRKSELTQIRQILNSGNHLIMISPRRFGKTSLIRKALQDFPGKVMFLDIQLVNSVEDLAAQCLKRIYKLYPSEKIRQFIKNFRFIPVISLQPVTNEIDISIQPGASSLPLLEDVFNLMEKLGTETRRLVVVMDEFQDLLRLEKGIDRKLRSIIQLHKNINYIFIGSQESMMREIFEKKKSPFYHFGQVYPLQKIGINDFRTFLVAGLQDVSKSPEVVAEEIFSFSGGHPYYTQQLAYMVWNILKNTPGEKESVSQAIHETVQLHDYDYERLWNTYNNTDKKTMTGLAELKGSQITPVFQREYQLESSSTAFSSVKRLMQKGVVIKSERGFEMDDPFFREWIVMRRTMYLQP